MTDEISNEKLWNQNFIFTSLANFFAFTAMYYIMSTLPLFTTEVLGGSNRDVGILFGLFAFAGVIARPCAGYMLDMLGRKKIAWLSLFALLVAMFLYNWAVSLLFLLILRIIHGICWGFSTTSLATLATDAIPFKKRGEGIGYFGLSMSLAMLIGPSLGLAVLHSFDYSTMFCAGTCLAAVSLLCLIGVKHNEIAVSERYKEKEIIKKKVLSDAVILFFVAIVYSAVLSFIVLFAQEINVENSGLFFLANAVTVIISRPYAGRIMDQKGPVEIMCVGFCTLCATFICLFFANGYILFLAAALLLGVGFGIIFSLSFTLAINKVDISRRGMVNGTMLTAFDLGFALGSALLGLVSTYTGLRLMYLISGALVIIPFAIFYIKYIIKAKPATAGEDGYC
ncbi:Staphylopine export protein [Sporomusa carbonis]|jgi:MFS family permease|uniref:MFS transporter n=1 Tax=Sporomusa carbonis TaxID=3076075 RepID=UPI003A67016B